MRSVIYLTTRVPSRFAADLEGPVYRVFEAAEVSEVLHLCEHQTIDAIVIDSDVADPDVIEVQMREITVRLKPEMTSKELVWELTQLFPDNTMKVQ